MLAVLGLLTIAVLLLVILKNWLSPLIALITVPVAASIIAGFGLETGKFMVDGIRAVAPVAGMFLFAIVYFGVVTDAGMLDPIIDRIVGAAGARPARVTLGTALLALLIHLDGSGAVCFLITIPAMLPIYDRLHMDRRVLAAVASLAAGVNFLPWTGPTIRAASALKLSANDIFRPLIPVQVVCLVFVFAVSWLLGKREERRLGLVRVAGPPASARTLAPDHQRLRRPRLFWINILLTIAIMAAMIGAKVEPVVAFMLGVALALVINYPDVKLQKERVDAHAKAALMMVGILLAAGVFTGIMGSKGTNMLKAIAELAVGCVPHSAAQHIPFGLGLIAMPLSLVFDPDSYYFGVMPVVAEVVKHLGGQPIEVAQASLLGQMTTGFPVSPLTPATFLIVGLTGIDLGAHQRFTIPLLFLASVIMTLTAAIMGVIPF
jgi:CitMHS family citrate-Mg2+:H+ or citrate-Ca2+:H+ symporter